MRNALILSKVTLWQIPARIAKQFNRAGKSQISIFNDQNDHDMCIAFNLIPYFAGHDADGHHCR